MLTPQDLGLPHASWRPGQWDFVQGIADAITSGQQHQLLIAPTGFGKSLTYMGLAALTGMRVVILTATKSLEDQLIREFAEVGMVDVRGRANYPCDASLDPRSSLQMFFRKGVMYTAATAPCKRRIQCDRRGGGCGYFDAVRAGVAAQVTVTNYDFWFHNQWRFQEANGSPRGVDLLVMDEAHQAPDALAGYLSFRLPLAAKSHFNGRLPDVEDVAVWAEWAGWASRTLLRHIDEEGHHVSHDIIQLQADLERMAAQLPVGEWVVEQVTSGFGRTARREWAFDCINPEAFGQEALWGQVSATLMVSATVNLMTASAIGIPKAEVKVWEAKSGFPLERRPVYVVKGAPRLNFRSLDGEKRMWVALIDRIVRARQDRKGIAHTTSFERGQYLLAHSSLKQTMTLTESRSTLSTVATHKGSRTPGLLVSPSLTTGWDFPGKECEYQVIGKIPFPDLRSKASKARSARNKEWAGYTAAQTIVQASGRGMRYAEDQCETFIVDGNFDWWYGDNKKFLPKWWVDALVWVDLAHLPVPPPLL